MSSMSSNLSLEINFQFRKQEKVTRRWFSEYEGCCTCTILHFTKDKLWWVWRVLHLHNPAFHQRQALVSMKSAALTQSCISPKTSSGEYEECCTYTILQFHQRPALMSMKSAALAQSCISPKTSSDEYEGCCTCTILHFTKDQLWWVWRVLHLHNPAFHQRPALVSMKSAALAQSCISPKTSSGEYEECCTCTILHFTKDQLWWVWRVLHLHNPAFHQRPALVSMKGAALAQSCISPKTSSDEYEGCCTCTILHFTKDQLSWVWRVLHLQNPVFYFKDFFRKEMKLASWFLFFYLNKA